jgi:hypothetical protein
MNITNHQEFIQESENIIDTDQDLMDEHPKKSLNDHSRLNSSKENISKHIGKDLSNVEDIDKLYSKSSSKELGTKTNEVLGISDVEGDS